MIFYGLNNDVKETPEMLMSKVQTIIKVSVGIRRDIPIPKVMRMYNGENPFYLYFLSDFISDIY